MCRARSGKAGFFDMVDEAMASAAMTPSTSRKRLDVDMPRVMSRNGRIAY
jgi:hypothetical protein